MANKYGARITEIDGIKFASRLEAKVYAELRLSEKANEISELELQPRFEIIPKFKGRDGKTERAVHYTADFRYKDSDGNTVVVEVKGYEARDYPLRKKLFKWQNPDVIFREVRWGDV